MSPFSWNFAQPYPISYTIHFSFSLSDRVVFFIFLCYLFTFSYLEWVLPQTVVHINLLHQLFNSQISIVVLLTVCHTILIVLVWRNLLWISKSLIGISLFSCHLSTWYCMDVWKRNISITVWIILPFSLHLLNSIQSNNIVRRSYMFINSGN